MRLGAYRTSIVASPYVEAGEMLLSPRRKKLAVQYVLKLKSNLSNPATYNCVFLPDLRMHFQARPQVIVTQGICMQSHKSDAGVNVNCVVKQRMLYILPWFLRAAQFDLTLHEIGSKSDVSPNVFRSRFNKSILIFGRYSRIYTNAYKENAAVAAAPITVSSAGQASALLLIDLLSKSACDPAGAGCRRAI
jgi:hypothetical protein